MFRWAKTLYRNIKNLVVWFPVIWRDRQYDHNYIIYLLLKKFELMEKHMKSKECMASVNQDRYIRQVQICKHLCDRISNHNYLSSALTRHNEIYGDKSGRRWHSEPMEEKPGWRLLVWDDTPQERASFRRAGKQADIIEKQDYEMLFKIMNRNIRMWWD